MTRSGEEKSTGILEMVGKDLFLLRRGEVLIEKRAERKTSNRSEYPRELKAER